MEENEEQPQYLPAGFPPENDTQYLTKIVEPQAHSEFNDMGYDQVLGNLDKWGVYRIFILDDLLGWYNRFDFKKSAKQARRLKNSILISSRSIGGFERLAQISRRIKQRVTTSDSRKRGLNKREEEW